MVKTAQVTFCHTRTKWTPQQQCLIEMCRRSYMNVSSLTDFNVTLYNNVIPPLPLRHRVPLVDGVNVLSALKKWGISYKNMQFRTHLKCHLVVFLSGRTGRRVMARCQEFCRTLVNTAHWKKQSLRKTSQKKPSLLGSKLASRQTQQPVDCWGPI